jgi:hypothetical protein
VPWISVLIAPSGWMQGGRGASRRRLGQETNRERSCRRCRVRVQVALGRGAAPRSVCACSDVCASPGCRSVDGARRDPSLAPMHGHPCLRMLESSASTACRTAVKRAL